MTSKHHLIVLSAGFVLALAACTASASPSPLSTASAPEASPSGTAVGATPEPSGPAATETVVPSVAAAPTAAPPKAYDCTALITDPEMQAATGLTSAVFFKQERWTDNPGLPEGQTYCQFFANQGALSIAVSALTGPSYAQLMAALAGAPASDELPGIGEHASISGTSGGARSHGVIVTVVISDTSGSGLPADLDPRAAITQILKLTIVRI